MLKKLLPVATLLGLALPASASAQVQRTWVSQAGSDSNDCAYATPCLTFQRAADPLNEGGEINAQTDGNFGEFSITKSLTVDGRGHSVGITAFGTGVSINAPGKKVTLRNLHIQGFQGSGDGVDVVDALRVRLDHVTIRNMGGNGVDFRMAPTPSRLSITHSAITDNTLNGVIASASAAGQAGAYKRIVIRHSEIEANGDSGVRVVGPTPATTNPIMTGVFDSTLADNDANGLIISGAYARGRIGGNVITGNFGYGIRTIFDALLYSFGRNRIYANNPDGSATGGAPES